MDEQQIRQLPQQEEIPSNKKKKRRRRRKKHMPVGKMILLDLMAIILGLLVFALFHHVLEYWGVHLWEKSTGPVVVATLPPVSTPEASVTPPPAESAEPTPEPEAEPSPEPTPTRVYSGMWGEKFADKFTDGEVIQTENSYQSANVNVTVEKVEQPGLVYYIADVYVSDLKYFGSAFANGEGTGNYNSSLALIDVIADRVHAIAAIGGDHYYGRPEGIVVRNGTLYRETRNQDVCVLYTDGRMETLTNDELDFEALKEAGLWQVWSFGPGLLDDEGHALSFADRQPNVLSVNPRNPRCAIGYYEPGHYCLVEIEGRRAGAYVGSEGMTLSEMAVFFEELGCKSAYNLDGGRSAVMSWMDKRISVNYGRTISDIIFVTDTPIGSEE